MSDVMRVAPDVETPVNPYSLLEAVNRSSDTAHTAWLIFLAIMAYMTVAVAGVTHKALLLETPVSLPLLQVQIPITQFFEFSPIILALFHLGVVSQLVLLARKTLEFDQAIRLLESTDRRTHPLRLELHNFFFVQAIAGPHRSMVMSAFLHVMSWLTLVILPVLLILYVQVVFLPYHDVGITWTHRITLLADIAMLVLIGVFLVRSEANFFTAFWRSSTSNPLSFVATGLVLALAGSFSLFVATVPGEPLDQIAQRLVPPGASIGADGRELRQTASFAMPFVKTRTDGSLLGFQRNLVITDTDLVVDKEVSGDEPTLNLRGRDLRFAKLDRTDLHQADLTGADLSDASLAGADLRRAVLSCASLDELLLTENRVAARCVSARRANLKKARLAEAQLTGIDLRGAELDEAQLEGAELPYALLTGASLAGARLDKADLTGGVQAQAANFLVASLQGADLTGAQLQGADFSSATLQGTILAHARLHGAMLRDADLEGADLTFSRLQAADLTGARIRAADLRGAGVWMTLSPAQDAMALSDFTDLTTSPLADGEAASLAVAVERVADGPQRAQLKTTLAGLQQGQASRSWSGSSEQLRWDSMVKASAVAIGEGYKSQLTDYLGRLACRPRFANGGVATGVARRAQTPQFRGELLAINDRLRAADCPVGQRILPRVLRDLGQVADTVRSN